MSVQLPPLTDTQHARAILDAQTELESAIAAAIDAGLTVEADVHQSVISISVSRPIILPRFSDGALIHDFVRKAQ